MNARSLEPEPRQPQPCQRPVQANCLHRLLISNYLIYQNI